MSVKRKISLAALTAGLQGIELTGGASTAVTGLAYDSRKVKPGDLFIAVPGTKDDGTKYAEAAIKAGARAVLADKALLLGPTPVIVAADVRLAMGLLAARFFGRPDQKMELVAVTGTNGKTTITYIVESILRAAGKVPGVLGTVNYRLGGETRPADNTTPESVDIFETLAWMREAGATHVVMEASSHALDQKRLSGLAVRGAAFTNLTRDHLDYHRGFEEYYAAKKKLFTEVITGHWSESAPPSPFAAVNTDNEQGRRLAKELKGTGVALTSYSASDKSAGVFAATYKSRLEGITATFHAGQDEIEVRSPLVGGHNLENLLASVTIAVSLGIAPGKIAEGITSLKKVPGRLEPVPNQAGIAVLVDYAHTPDALEHAVDTCRELARGRLITVFGCGGDRDRGKRPLMGKIAVTGSDLAVVTSDNPRTEDPDAIISEILAGIGGLGAKKLDDRAMLAGEKGYAVIPDRQAAIEAAVQAARPGDVVLIAGKGHEDYQILGKKKIHFDDREIAARALEKKS